MSYGPPGCKGSRVPESSPMLLPRGDSMVLPWRGVEGFQLPSGLPVYVTED